jgi:hypothetical protein
MIVVSRIETKEAEMKAMMTTKLKEKIDALTAIDSEKL